MEAAHAARKTATSVTEPAHEQSDPPSVALQAAVGHVHDRSGRGLTNALMMDVVLWGRSARPLLSADYQAQHTAQGAEFFLESLLRTIAFYQQLHVVIAGTVVLARLCAEPPIPKIESLQKLEEELGKHPDVELKGRLAGIQREVRYLRWLGSVRNKAVQHRAGNEHYSSDGILLPDGLAFIRRHQPLDDHVVIPAREELERLNRIYGLALDTAGTSEVFAYLDLVSQQFYGAMDDEFDQLRRLIQNPRLYQVIMSPHLIENVDHALAALITMIPAERSRRLSERT
jgi:hypothetical protein